MTAEPTATGNEASSDGEDANSVVDAVCALVVIVTLVVGAIYHVWVSGL